MSQRKFEFWCDSGANAFSCRRGDFTLEELGISDQEWNMMEEDERDNIVKDIALAQLDWGYREI